MRAWTVLGFGLRRLRRHLMLPLVLYSLAAIPALVLAWLATSGFADTLDHSLYARSSAAEGSALAWLELLGAPSSPKLPWSEGLILASLGLIVGQIFVAGGLVESLLERQARERVPFVTGLYLHARRFAFSFLWAATLLAAAGLVVSLSLAGASILSKAVGQTAWPWTFFLAVIALAAFGGSLHLAYDLSRIAAASHHGRRCLRGLLAAWWHVLRHPMGLVPVYFVCAATASAAGSIAWLFAWQQLPASTYGLGGLLLAQQLGMLAAATSRCLLWSSAVGYYQAIGEPAWAGKCP